MKELYSTLLNDMHAGMNATRVARLCRPESVEEVVALVIAARAAGVALSVSGGRHAMGGQQFGSGTWHIDLRGLSSISEFDGERGLVTAGAGIAWRELITGYTTLQGDDVRWGIRQKQTGADALTLGGALSANIHGRGIRLPPLINDVESFLLVDAFGALRRCSRAENSELFSRVIGGYGMFGLIVEVTLRLAKRVKIERRVEVMTLDDLVRVPGERETQDWLFGDFQFSIDESSPDFLQRGVFSSYRELPEPEWYSITHQAQSPHRELGEADWQQLLYLAHTDRAQAFEVYATYYLGTHGQHYWSDTHQLTTYLNNYHEEIDRLTGATCPGSEMISELYVPRESLSCFMREAAEWLRDAGAPVIYGTIRLIERDDESALPWAREPWACIIFNLHVDHHEAGIATARRAFLGLIDRAIALNGSFYLTYHRWATREQVERCHPRFSEFLEAKLRFDPEERFTSDWYRHYKALFKA